MHAGLARREGGREGGREAATIVTPHTCQEFLGQRHDDDSAAGGGACLVELGRTRMGLLFVGRWCWLCGDYKKEERRSRQKKRARSSPSTGPLLLLLLLLLLCLYRETRSKGA